MRKSSYVTKTVSDSLLGLALLASPLAFLGTPSQNSDTPVQSANAALGHVDDTSSACEGLCGEAPLSQTALGQFLETEIANRIERVSGKHLDRHIRIARAREIASAIAEASYTYGVDPFLVMSMIEVESRYNTKALGRHGEIGLMQIKPSTAKWVAPVTDALWDCDLHEIRCNIMMGTRYVSHLQLRTEKFQTALQDGDELPTSSALREHVLRSYNLGPAKANRLAVMNNRVPAMETVNDSVQEPTTIPYATKIGTRADRFRSRYFAMAVASVQ